MTDNFKQAQDLLYAMAAKTPVCIIVLLIIVCLMVFNATFNNISVISWLSVLLVEEAPIFFALPLSSVWNFIFLIKYQKLESTQTIMAVSFIGGVEYPEKTTDLSQVTDELYTLYRVHLACLILVNIFVKKIKKK
jgi:hypothetical protein